MGALLSKEFRAQIPFALLGLFLVSTGYLFQGIKSPLTLMPTERLYGEGLINLGTDHAVVMFLLSIAISYGLLVREFDDRSIEFLDALPISRAKIFWAKWIAAFCTLALLPLIDLGFIFSVRWISKTSLDTSYHLDWIGTSVALQLVEAFCFLSIGMALSFLRRFGLLFLCTVLWGLLILGRFNPTFDPTNLVLWNDSQFFGKTWLVPWRLTVGYLVVGAIALAIAYGLFVGWGRILVRMLAGSESRAKQVLLIGSSALIVFVVVGMMTQIALTDVTMDEDPKAVRVTYPSWSTASRSTKRFDAVYPTNLAGRAGELLDEADEIYGRVAKFFDYEADTRVSVDMTSYSGHHLGTAYWNKLKLDLTAHEDMPGLRRTLGHETTHVVLESLSDNQLRQKFASTRFFHEGVATYVERRFFSDSELAQQRIGAALLQERGETSFDRLVDNDKLRAEHDSYLAYQLGEVFAAAIVSRFGDDAIGKLARTFADKRHSEGLGGVALWRSIFQASGYSLNEAIDEYYKLLDEAKELHQETVAKLPELRPTVEMNSNAVSLTTIQVPPEGWKIVVRFRPSISAPDDQYWEEEMLELAEDTYVFSASRDSFVGRVAWYQIGYRQPKQMAIFQPWKSVKLK
ncbi:MAG: ABC transporter permease subunit [Pirellulaceae bacterium]